MEDDGEMKEKGTTITTVNVHELLLTCLITFESVETGVNQL
jgi:hypothetical protein